jgi:drug/metabolite transporter (DMT)-like permease
MALGVFAMTWAAILVRWAEAPALSIAFWRMAIAAACLLVFCALARIPFWRSWRGIDWWSGGAAALLLALHFAFWISSLEYTTVAASGVMVSTQPVFVAVLGRAFLRERPSRAAWTGIGLAILGTGVIAGADFALDRRALLGDALALFGAAWISIYYVLARMLRATKDLVPYITVIYAMTTGWLLVAAVAGGDSLTGWDTGTWTALAGLALAPTILGHSAMNYALGYMPAFKVNIAILGEPVGAAIWAALLLDERPGAGTLIGGVLILAGIWLTLGRRVVRDPVVVANL